MLLNSFRALLSATLLAPSAGQAVVNLSKFDWTVSNAALNVTVPGSLPSQAHLDLYAAQVIGDPYYGLNDFNLRWVAWSNWTYTATISGLSEKPTCTIVGESCSFSVQKKRFVFHMASFRRPRHFHEHQLLRTAHRCHKQSISPILFRRVGDHETLSD